MRRTLILLATTMALCGCETTGYGGPREEWRGYRNYDYNRPPPSGRYDASHYYRDDARYRERRLSRNDRVYRGTDGRYYCRRPDGTTGLVIGAVAGGAIGNALAPGDSQVLGTLLGAGIGGAVGREIERGQVRCR